MVTKMKTAILSALLLVFAAGTPAQAQTAATVNSSLDTLFGNHAPYQKFFTDLKKAVAAGDKAAVAAMVDYPLQTRVGGKTVKLKNAAQFVAAYDKIVTAKLKKAVASQTYESLFSNWQGVSIADGKIWFSGAGKDGPVKITAINN